MNVFFPQAVFMLRATQYFVVHIQYLKSQLKTNVQYKYLLNIFFVYLQFIPSCAPSSYSFFFSFNWDFVIDSPVDIILLSSTEFFLTQWTSQYFLFFRNSNAQQSSCCFNFCFTIVYDPHISNIDEFCHFALFLSIVMETFIELFAHFCCLFEITTKKLFKFQKNCIF